MYQNYKRKAIDPMNPYLPVYHGIFELEVPVSSRKRRMLVYIPEDVREATSGIMVLGEKGKTADDLLRESGWCELADQDEDKEKFIVFFLEPEDGMWHTDEEYGQLEGDIAYIEAAAARMADERFHYCVHEAKRYIVGCREGGVMAHMAVAWNPTFYAGLATVGGTIVSKEYFEAASEDYCTVLSGFVDELHRRDIRKGDIAVPAWIIEDSEVESVSENPALEYWCEACGTEENPRQLAPDVEEYFRTVEPPYGVNQHREAHRVFHSRIAGASKQHGKRMLRRIWTSFLSRQRRWMGSPTGDLRMVREAVKGMGMEYHFELYDGWMREWYTYLPKAVRENPGKKVPLVLAMHGYTCDGDIYANHTEWYRVAEKYGFIAVFPTALFGVIDMENDCIDPRNTPLPAWNIFEEEDRPDELHFFSYLLDRMCGEYPVDASRVYATGHSWGSLMTQMLALAMPERFAAVAPCSGVFFGDAEKRMLQQPRLKNRPDVEIPVWMFCGEEEDFLIHAVPEHDNATGFNIAMWLQNNHMADQIPTEWSDCKPEADGQWHDQFFNKKEVPMVRFTSVAYMGHATMTEMSLRIWEQFFSKFSRENGQVHFTV